MMNNMNQQMPMVNIVKPGKNNQSRTDGKRAKRSIHGLYLDHKREAE